ncbi:MAG: aldo/keto reductase [Bacteroidales bacterium]|nr:aldo/keto reductase [Bacteroidales bacterium]
MERRDFLKISGTGLLGAAAMSVAGCSNNSGQAGQAVESLGKVVRNYPQAGLLGFGAMRWPMIKDADGTDIIDQEKVNEMVDLALEHGVNYFDTAPVYLQGKSEAATGTALHRHPRDSYMVATKLSNFSGPWTFQAGVDMYRRSFENLQTDYIDFYLLHSLSGRESFRKRFLDNGLIDFLLAERQAGRIRHLGFSFHGSREGFDEMMEMHAQYHWDFVQIQMNYSDWYSTDGEESEYMYTRLDELEIPVVIMEPLLGGRLANIPAPLEDMLKAVEPEASAASWAFRFCGSHPRIFCVLSGMTYKEHLEDNLRTFCNFTPLEESDYTLLQTVAAGLGDYHLIDCTDCKYCMPCPYGIDIPGLFQFFNRHITQGTYVASSAQKDYDRMRRKYLTDYDKTVQTVRQADHCCRCFQCLSKCPQKIQIPDELRRIDTYVEDLKQGKI